jgi:hypothetical protein
MCGRLRDSSVVLPLLLCLSAGWGQSLPGNRTPRMSFGSVNISELPHYSPSADWEEENPDMPSHSSAPDFFMPASQGQQKQIPTATAANTIKGATSALAPSFNSLSSPLPAVSFEAQKLIRNAPPDTAGAVGPNHAMSASNDQVIIQDRQGHQLSSTSLNGFWQQAFTSISLAWDPNEVPSGGTVTVPAGSTSATFAITTSTANASTPVTISASYSGLTQTSVLTVNPPLFLQVSPSTVTGGLSSTGTVTLTSAAPAGGAIVTISGNNAAEQVPSSGTVTVPAGSTNATFPITTNTVTAATPVTISASYNGVTQTVVLTVDPPPSLLSISVVPSTETGSLSPTGTVTLTNAAPTGGVVVSLSSNNAAAQVPSGGTVTILAGSTSATFPITTNTVTAATPVTISASYNGVTQTTVLTVAPPPSLQSGGVSVIPSTVIGGQSSTGIVTLTSPAPTSTVVTISSNNAAAQVPSSGTVTPSAQASVAHLSNASYGTALVCSQPTDKVYSVTCTIYSSDTCTVGGAAINFPIPQGVVTPTGTDHNTAFIYTTQDGSPYAGMELDCWQPQYNSTTDTWSCSVASLVHNIPNGWGTCAEADILGFHCNGGYAAGFDLSAGPVRPEEIAAGVIPHALLAAISNPGTGILCPATHTDQSGTGIYRKAGSSFFLRASTWMLSRGLSGSRSLLVPCRITEPMSSITVDLSRSGASPIRTPGA